MPGVKTQGNRQYYFISFVIFKEEDFAEYKLLSGVWFKLFKISSMQIILIRRC